MIIDTTVTTTTTVSTPSATPSHVPGTGRSQLSSTTPEYSHLEYTLQLTLRASTARIVTAYAISNPHLSVQFDRRSKDIMTLPVWLDASYFGGINTEEDVVRRGFRFPPPAQGLRFRVGMMDGICDGLDEQDILVQQSRLPSTSSPSNTSSPTKSITSSSTKHQPSSHRCQLRKAVVCMVAVGRAYVADEGTAERDPVPDGYDSFLLQDPSIINDTSYRPIPTYYIKNPAQIIPSYIIHYEYDPIYEHRSREQSKCDNCEDDVATLHCMADNANLCVKCDAVLHQNKLSSRHLRSPIGKGADVFGSCRHHSDKPIEFFCSQCHVPVCVFCKMVGHHANGEAARHQLVGVTEAYQSALKEAMMSDPVLQARKTEIMNQIGSVNSRARAVEKMGSQIEQQIEEMYQRAMQDLRSIIQSKLTVLLGDELELKRQLTEIDRMEDFLKYQQTGDAMTFLFNWSRHQHYRANVHDFRFFRNDIDVQLDAKVTGGITVVVDDDGRHAHGNSRSVVTGHSSNVNGVVVNGITGSMSMTMTSSPTSSPPMNRLSITTGITSPIGQSNNTGTSNASIPSSGLVGSVPSTMLMSMQNMTLGGIGTTSRMNMGRSNTMMTMPSSSAATGHGNAGGMATTQISSSTMPRLNTGPIGLGMPNKLGHHAHTSRRVQRRTSEFFAEALGSSFDITGHASGMTTGSGPNGLPCDDDLDRISNAHHYE